jgi:hypothetical protein
VDLVPKLLSDDSSLTNFLYSSRKNAVSSSSFSGEW